MQQLLSKREVASYVKLHAEHVMRLARTGKFPKPIKLGSGKNCAVRFVADEVDAWLTEKLAERGTKP